MKNRPPIVTILGHVDHGKTTLLDKIRNTRVQAGEAGGITQSIGASVLTTKDSKEITFIDTPGHAAFASMRQEGTRVADVVVLVVAADDGVKPQTKEAIEYIKDSKTPFLVALTKVDLDTAQEEKALASIEKEDIQLEKRGGDVPWVKVSGKTGQGIDDLLETIFLLYELNETKDEANTSLKGAVIETKKGKGGPEVSAVIKEGTLKVGQEVASGGLKTKIRGLFNEKRESVKEVLPGHPALILGFSDLPPVGAQITSPTGTESQETGYQKRDIPEVEEGQIAVVLKADTKGSLDALEKNIPEDVVIIDKGVGEVSESDIFTAKSANAVGVYSFEAPIPSRIKKLADTEGLEVKKFDIIYKLFEYLEEKLEKGRTKILGHAQILDSFPFNKKRVAGGKVVKGELKKDGNTVLMSEKGESRVKITSLKKGKEDVDSVKEGEEFGAIFEPQLDFEAGDMLLSVAK